MPRGRHITNEDFENVKVLMKFNFTIDEICRQTGLSVKTITFLAKANSFEEYQELKRTDCGYKTQRCTEETNQTDYTDMLNSILEAIKEQNEMLKSFVEAFK